MKTMQILVALALAGSLFIASRATAQENCCHCGNGNMHSKRGSNREASAWCAGWCKVRGTEKSSVDYGKRCDRDDQLQSKIAWCEQTP